MHLDSHTFRGILNPFSLLLCELKGTVLPSYQVRLGIGPCLGNLTDLSLLRAIDP